MRYLTVILALTLASSAFAQQALQEDTAVSVWVGPFLDDADGTTAITTAGGNGGSIETNVRLFKNSDAAATRDSASDPSLGYGGWYLLPLSEVDTSTPGRLIIVSYDPTNYQEVFNEFEVLPANMFAARRGTDLQQTDTVEIEGVDSSNQLASNAGIGVWGALVDDNDDGPGSFGEGWSSRTVELQTIKVATDQLNFDGGDVLATLDGEDVNATDSVWGATRAGNNTAGTFGEYAPSNVTHFGGSAGQFTAGRPAVQSVAGNVSISTGTSEGIAQAVWENPTRVLTAGTNISLAKGTGVTGFNDITAASVWASATRTLSSGANIVLAKGTGVTGFNDISTSDVSNTMTTVLGNTELLLTSGAIAEIVQRMWNSELGDYPTPGTMGYEAGGRSAIITAVPQLTADGMKQTPAVGAAEAGSMEDKMNKIYDAARRK